MAKRKGPETMEAPAKRRTNANGEGSVHRFRDKWRAELMIGITPDGKKKRIRHLAATRKEAAEWLANRIAERTQGTLVEPTKETVGQFVARWVEKTAPLEVGPSTVRLYTNLNNWYVEPNLGRIALSDLKPRHVQEMLHAIIDAGKSPRTAQLARVLLRRALQQAVEWGQLPRNPVDLVKAPRQERVEVQALTPEQLAVFLEAARQERLHALFILAATTGLRQGEILALRWQDVDLAVGTLSVTQTMKVVLEEGEDGKKRERYTFGQTKTKSSRRSISLPAMAVTALKKWKAEQNQEKLRLGDAEAWGNPELIFSTETGQPISPNNLRKRAFRRILEAADLPRIRFHDLRHSYATFLAIQGVSDTVMQKVLGHSTITITKNLYVHVLERQKEEAARKVDDFFQTANKKVR